MASAPPPGPFGRLLRGLWHFFLEWIVPVLLLGAGLLLLLTAVCGITFLTGGALR